MFQALAQAQVNLIMISTSEIKVSVAIDPAVADQAVRAVHAAFNLGAKPAASASR
jgi:aspartate kinase